MIYYNAANLKSELPGDQAADTPCVLLAGAGVVGRAILGEHLRRGFSVLLLDLSDAALQRAADEAVAALGDLQSLRVPSPLAGLAAIRLGSRVQGQWRPELLIESIPENLELKRSFFASACQALDPNCILGSNTSNLRIADIFDRVPDRAGCVGIHFFMPVAQRPLVELIPGEDTASATLQRCREHARGLDKETLVTRDSPGFVVNRLLVPYLNQSLLLLGRGASPQRIADAAQRFGMPLSPLALIDLIGIRTAFDSGRVFWQSFPKRIDPAPILSGMIKAGRLGAAFGGGFFAGTPNPAPTAAANPAAASFTDLHPEAIAVIDRYQREPRSWTEAEILMALALPMWIEAAEILAAGVVDSCAAIELGVRGGLGFQGTDGFFAFFDAVGGEAILAALQAATDQASLVAPPYLRDQLQLGLTPSEAVLRYVGHARQTAAAAAAGTQA